MRSSRAYEEEYKVAGLGQVIQKGEGEVYTYDTPLSGAVIRYTHLTYALAFRITREMLEDDLYGVMNKMSSELAKSAAYNKDVQATSILNNAFNNAYTGFDGLELCSDVHVNLGGGTQANKAATDVDLDLPALQAAVETFESWTDDRGFKLDYAGKMLLHNVGDIWTSGEILGSEFIPTSADNAINVIKTKYNITPHLLKHLTDADAWFLVGDKSDHDMKMWLRVDDEFDNDDDPNNGDAIFSTRHRLSTGHGDWRGIYGSSGN